MRIQSKEQSIEDVRIDKQRFVEQIIKNEENRIKNRELKKCKLKKN